MCDVDLYCHETLPETAEVMTPPRVGRPSRAHTTTPGKYILCSDAVTSIVSVNVYDAAFFIFLSDMYMALDEPTRRWDGADTATREWAFATVMTTLLS